MTPDGIVSNRARPDPGMDVARERTIKSTVSLCPTCLSKIDAEVVVRSGQVWLNKSCPTHGDFEVLLSSDATYYYETSAAFSETGGCCSTGSAPGASPVDISTPWANHSCTVLIEITERCNLSCPTCFAASSPAHTKMMSMETFRSRLDRLIAGGKHAADTIQLSGGEPTIHPHLIDMLDTLFSSGFLSVTINSNGIKLAQSEFVERLTECVRSHPNAELFVYLQFDGFDDQTHQRLRGRGDLLDLKRRALDNCIRSGISVHPVMTLTRDVNDHEVGDFISLAVDNPAIKHVVIQPAMYSGRYENPRLTDRLTLADTAKLIIEQFGRFEAKDFGPIPCSDPNCHSIAVALRHEGGLIPVSRYFPRFEDWGEDKTRDLIDHFSDSLDGPGGFAAALQWAMSDDNAASRLADVDDAEIDRLLDAMSVDGSVEQAGWDRMLTISIKPFMDALTFDQQRIDKCCVHVLDDEGNPISLCQFNAINRTQSVNGEQRVNNAA